MQEQLPTLVLGNDAGTVSEIQTLLSGLETPTIPCTVGRFEQGLQLVRENAYDIALVVLDSDPKAALSLMEELNSAVPSTHIFALSRDDSTENIVRAMHAGATEFLSLPLEASHAVRALIKVSALRRLAHATGKPGQIWTVYGPKGGAGTTTLGANLAVELQAAGNKSVCFVDLDFQSADAALFLNVNPVYTMMDITLNFRRLDSVFLQGTLTRHPSGIYLLAAPPHGQAEAVSIPVDQIRGVFDLLKTMYDVVIVDTPSTLTQETLAALQMSTRVLLLIELTLPFLRGYRRTMDVLDALGVPADRVDVIVSKYGSARAEVPLDEAKKTLGFSTVHTLPRDDETALGAVNKGVPLAEIKSNSALRRAIVSLAEALAGSATEQRKRKGILGGLFAS